MSDIIKWDINYEKKAEIKGREIIASIHLNRMSQRYFNLFDHILTSIITVSIFCIGFFKNEKLMDGIIVYISFSLGIIKIFQTFFNFRGQASVYETTRNSYEDIVDYITEELAESRNNRKISPDVFIKQIVKDINSVNKNAPYIYDFIINKFYKKYKNLKTAKPLTVNQIEIIINNSDNVDEIETDINQEVPDSVIQTHWMKRIEKTNFSKKVENLFAEEMVSRISKKNINYSFEFEMRRLYDQHEKSLILSKSDEKSEEKSEEKSTK